MGRFLRSCGFCDRMLDPKADTRRWTVVFGAGGSSRWRCPDCTEGGVDELAVMPRAERRRARRSARRRA